MTIRSTYTFAELEVSPAAYDEIAKKLRDADYGHAFSADGTIDMHGIGLTRAGPQISEPFCGLPDHHQPTGGRT